MAAVSLSLGREVWAVIPAPLRTHVHISHRHHRSPNPPISSYSLGEDDAETASSTGCGSERVLKSTVTEEHSYIYAGGRLLRETITTTAVNGTVTTKVLDFAYDARNPPIL